MFSCIFRNDNLAAVVWGRVRPTGPISVYYCWPDGGPEVLRRAGAHRLIRTIGRGQLGHRAAGQHQVVVRRRYVLLALAARRVVIVLLRGRQPHRPGAAQTVVSGHDFPHHRHALHRVTHLLTRADRRSIRTRFYYRARRASPRKSAAVENVRHGGNRTDTAGQRVVRLHAFEGAKASHLVEAASERNPRGKRILWESPRTRFTRNARRWSESGRTREAPKSEKTNYSYCLWFFRLWW